MALLVTWHLADKIQRTILPAPAATDSRYGQPLPDRFRATLKKPRPRAGLTTRPEDPAVPTKA